MVTRDIKADLIKKLSTIQDLIEGVAPNAEYVVSDVIDSLLSSMVTVTYSREESTSLPGDCDASELISRNID